MSLRSRVTEARYRWLLAARTARDTTPPPASAFAAFGKGSVLVPPSRVVGPQFVEIGSGVLIHEHAWISVVQANPEIRPRFVVGDRCNLGAQFHVACVGEVIIGDDVLAAGRCFVGDSYHAYEDPSEPVIRQPMSAHRPVHIGAGTFLGIGSVVLMGVTLGENAYVGAGAVVTNDVEPRTLVAGNPARPIKRWDDGLQTWVSAT